VIDDRDHHNVPWRHSAAAGFVPLFLDVDQAALLTKIPLSHTI
jgi:hypothetical protein